LESAAEAAAAVGDDERGIGFAGAALKEIDRAAEPARAASMLEQRGLMKFRLGHADGIDELREALRLMPAEPPTAARARMLAGGAKRMHASEPACPPGLGQEALPPAPHGGDPATRGSPVVHLP